MGTCRSLNDQQLLGFKSEPLHTKSLDRSTINYYGIVVQIKLLTELPELIWTRIDTEDYFVATQLFVFARHISTGEFDFHFFFVFALDDYPSHLHHRTSIGRVSFDNEILPGGQTSLVNAQSILPYHQTRMHRNIGTRNINRCHGIEMLGQSHIAGKLSVGQIVSNVHPIAFASISKNIGRESGAHRPCERENYQKSYRPKRNNYADIRVLCGCGGDW